jgi:hypothetical protein
MFLLGVVYLFFKFHFSELIVQQAFLPEHSYFSHATIHVVCAQPVIVVTGEECWLV